MVREEDVRKRRRGRGNGNNDGDGTEADEKINEREL